MNETCPVCGNPVSAQEPICPSCGFKLLGATQRFAPLTINSETKKAQEKPLDHAVLHVIRGPQTGVAFGLGEGELSVGRSPQCDLFLNDMTVSRMHATISKTPAGYAIADEHSFNGVWVNNESVDAPRVLKPDDVIQIGAFCLQYQEDRG